MLNQVGGGGKENNWATVRKALPNRDKWETLGANRVRSPQSGRLNGWSHVRRAVVAREVTASIEIKAEESGGGKENNWATVRRALPNRDEWKTLGANRVRSPQSGRLNGWSHVRRAVAAREVTASIEIKAEPTEKVLKPTENVLKDHAARPKVRAQSPPPRCPSNWLRVRESVTQKQRDQQRYAKGPDGTRGFTLHRTITAAKAEPPDSPASTELSPVQANDSPSSTDSSPEQVCIRGRWSNIAGPK